MRTPLINLLGIAITLLTLNLSAQTIVQGGYVSGTWTASGSPYLIQGPIQVADGSTLNIEPGVTVNFQGYYKMLIMGRLLAIGNQTDSISFTADDIETGWRGIRFDNTPSTNDTSKLIFCKVQYGNTQNSPSDINGGGIFFNNFSKAVVSHCLIANNNTEFHCGGCGGGICCIDGSPVITHNMIKGNKASLICYGSGGGIYITGTGKPYIAYNTITENSSGYGGGIYCTRATIINNTICNNSVPYNGAGIICEGYGNTTISNNMIAGNVAAGGWQGGGGIFVGSSNALIEDNTIINNVSEGEGGAGIYNQGNAVIRRNIISNNAATQTMYGFGGGIFTVQYGEEISDNVITNNYAHDGGGIYCKASDIDMSNNLVAFNDAVNGGGVYFSSQSNPAVSNCIIWGNTAINGATQVYLFDEPSDPAFLYCTIEGGLSGFNTAGNFYSGTYTNNLETYPQFISPSGGSGLSYHGYEADWSLPQSSSCIEAGDPLSISNFTDISGNPRVSGCRIDQGPFEIQITGSLKLELFCINESNYWACDGSATAIVTAGVPPYTYSWSTGSNASSITNLCGGPYTITVTDAEGCIRNRQVTIYNMLGFEDQVERTKIFQLYPNPASNYVVIKSETTLHNSSTIIIYNNLGTMVWSETLRKDQQRINTSGLKNGLYIVTVETEGKMERQKLIIQR